MLTFRADLRGFTDAAGAFGALLASSERERKTYGAEYDSTAEPHAAAFTPVAGDNSGTDAAQEPDDDGDFHDR